MKRNEAIKMILNYLDDEDIAIFTTGMISRETFDIKDREANFYMLGSMGLVSSVGLGIAINTNKKVIIFDGDGSMLMDMGTMALIGSQRPPNLIHIVLDNQSYQSTGGQPTVSNTVELYRVAIDTGYNCSVRTNEMEELETALKKAINKEGPHFILVKVLEKQDKIPERINLTPLQIKERFIRSLKE
jgi:thiamine pyrophosphate-dependent acetolactate synthase large subunit-like protein